MMLRKDTFESTWFSSYADNAMFKQSASLRKRTTLTEKIQKGSFEKKKETEETREAEGTEKKERVLIFAMVQTLSKSGLSVFMTLVKPSYYWLSLV